MSQPPPEDNYAVPPELGIDTKVDFIILFFVKIDDIDLNLKDISKTNHDYDEVPIECNHTENSPGM